jgi:undecaprenyl-diphosphatase
MPDSVSQPANVSLEHVICSQASAAWRRSERIALVLILVSVAVFVVLMCVISSPQIQAFDDSVVRSLRESGDPANPIGPDWIKELARDYTALGGYGVLTTLTALIAIFLGLDGKHRRARFMIFVVAVGYLVMIALKAAVGRPRPEIVPYLSHFHSASFPSGHSMMSAVVYILCSLMLADLTTHKRVGWLLAIAPIVISACVGFSRVYMGVHFPTDVLAGWCAGVTWALGCWLIAKRWNFVRSARP